MTTCGLPVLSKGQLNIGLAPQFGGALAWLRWQGIDILRPLPRSVDSHPTPERSSAAFPLVPYSNRIAHAQFSWQGVQYGLRRNFGTSPHSLHGFGWQRPWDLVMHQEHSAEMALQHVADTDWPWDCRATQHLSLDEHGLTLVLLITNLGKTVMPAGLGWHPYFLRSAQMTLQFDAEYQWAMNEHHLPERALPITDVADYRTERLLGWPQLDHCFSGWDGRARLYWPEHNFQVTLSAPELKHLVVFTPNQKDFVAIEPVSHINNAINSSQPEQQGIRTLAAGESMTRTVRLHIEQRLNEARQ